MSALGASKRRSPRHGNPSKPPRSILVLGGVPRADLLPPSVVAERRLRRAAGVVATALVVTVVVVLAAVGASFVHSAGAAASLEAERQRTNEILAGQSEFAEMSAALSNIDRLTAARAAVASTDIQWGPYLARVAELLPAGVTVSSVTVTAATPATPLPEAVGATGATRAATLVYTVASPDLASVRDWMLAIRDLPGYAGVMLQSVSETEGFYSAQVEIAVDAGAYSGRFAADEPAADGPTSGLSPAADGGVAAAGATMDTSTGAGR